MQNVGGRLRRGRIRVRVRVGRVGRALSDFPAPTLFVCLVGCAFVCLPNKQTNFSAFVNFNQNQAETQIIILLAGCE